ncbi:Inositol transporter [Thalictrum thalictroides]|uniref:Inositol transporter n=1 Tax=Thalictrum thalictroides TaxID=46969 RepID=A0A7J6XA60_THATH|nr:Inositol transporter [Thalictrum thalictroides]
MVEGAIQKANKAEFLDIFRLGRSRPFILRLAISAGIGGFLFGYDTGVIGGALLYIRDDFKEVQTNTSLKEAIVSTAVAGAIVGAALGGWMSDKFGRKLSILIADVLFFLGALLMAIAPTPAIIIAGRVLVGLGVGMASMTAPLYISEASPARIRGALVSFNGLLITGGQFIAYLINLGFTNVKGTWRWMLGIAIFPALIQFLLMLWLPESPRWLYRKGKQDEAVAILKKLYPADEVDEEVEALRSSVEAEIALEGPGDTSVFAKVKDAWGTPVVRKGLAAGIGVQVFQQLVGINTVMYYSPTIVQFAGIASNSTAIALSLITSGLNAVGSIVSMGSVDKYGRKKLMVISMVGIIICLCSLAAMFKLSDANAPKIDGIQTARFGNGTCPAYLKAPSASTWSCRSCLDASAECAYCSNSGNPYQPGACVSIGSDAKTMCNNKGGKSEYFTEGCPSKAGMMAILFLALYIICYSPGMGTAPWIVNSEIYPLRHRGIGGGMAAMANWTSNLIVSQTFLTLTKAVGSAYTFLIFAGFSTVGLIYIIWIVPETKGLSFEEVEKMLEERDMLQPWKKKQVDGKQ